MSGLRASALSWGLTVLMAAAAGVLLVLGPGRPLPSDLFGGVAGAAFLVLSLAYATVGAVIAFRLRGHRIGWLFSLIGLLSALNVLTYAYAEYGLYAQELPLARAAAVIWGSLELTAPLLALSLVLLPHGRLPSRRWRPVAAMSLGAIALLPIARLLMQTQTSLYGGGMRQLTCTGCARRFGCGVDTGACWCEEVRIDAPARRRLALEHADCLCRGCLEAAAPAAGEQAEA